MQSEKTVAILIALGCLAMFALIIVIILFVVVYQRKILLKEAKIKLMEQQQQIELFKASVEIEEQQKEKIARNLHDEINPLLALLKLNLSKHRMDARKDKFEPDNLIADSALLDKAIDGIRTTCLDLIPSFLLQYGIIKSLEEYIRNMQQIDGMHAEFENTVLEENLKCFDKQEQLNIYRVCLELLNNLFKHAKCDCLKMKTQSLNHSLCITFEHNGKGVTNEEMNQYTSHSIGLGLKSLKARALILNASIDYKINADNSTITLTIPYTV